MSSISSGNSIRVRFSKMDEESSAILMRSESTIENANAVLNTLVPGNDPGAPLLTNEGGSEVVGTLGSDPNVVRATATSKTIAVEPVEVGAESNIADKILDREDAGDCSSMDSGNTDFACRVVKQEKQLVLETPAPVLSTLVTSPSLEAPNFREGFSLEALIKFFQDVLNRYRRIPFVRFRLFFIAFFIASCFILPGFLSGLVAGIYISMILFLFICVSDSIPSAPRTTPPVCEKVLSEMSHEVAKEEKSRNIYKGWMNILNEHYNPHNFHVNTIQTVLVRLDGNMLRISRPERAMLKHAFHADPTLTEVEPRMMSQSIYDLSNATVKLRPRRLAKRRWFSRKYPICILLNSSHRDQFDYSSRHNSSSQSRRERDKSITSVDESIGEEDASSLNSIGMAESHTITEIGREADGYISDTDSSTVESEDEECLRRSASDCNVRVGEGPRPEFPRRKKQGLRSKSTRNIYLFARSTREKERWFHKLRRACGKYMLVDMNPYPDPESSLPRRRIQSLPAMDSLLNKLSHEYFLYILHNLQFLKHVDKIIADRSDEPVNGIVAMDLGWSSRKWQEPKSEASQEFIVMVNLLASRIFYDFCRDEYWCKAVQDKIQSKLATIHLPYFIETLELSKFDIGTAIPRILKVYAATVDEWGIWVDFEVKYEGLIKLIIETKVNLMKLKDQNESAESPVKSKDMPFVTSALRTTPSRYSDEDIPESPETSPDEDFGTKLKRDDHGGVKKKTGKKLLNIVDKITQSKYFKDASDFKPIRKMMEEISSTRLLLNVEITSLEGIMTLNLPPPPSDRLWYGFRKPPKMSAKAIPQVGDRSVVLSTVSDWIENKIQLLLEKNLVLPNMDDVIVPVCSGNELLQGPLNK